MKKSLKLFPTIDSDCLNEMNCNISIPKACYEYSGGSIELEIEQIDDSEEYSIVDKYERWNSKDHNLFVSGNISIENTSMLFGESGVTSDNSELALGIIWRSKASNLRSAKKIATFNKSTKIKNQEYKIGFRKSTIKESFELLVVVYLEKSIDNEKTSFAKRNGTILGTLARYDFILEGSGSQFTVVEKYAPKEALWSVECDWDDPTYDLFSDTVRIVLNTAHDAWQLFDDPNFKKEIIKEIMASSIHVIISKLEQDEYDIYGDYERGSVSEAMSYIVDRAKVDVTASETIASSIRIYLDKVMK